MPKKDLTDKQKLFCIEYLVDLNATQAAIRAGYSKKTAHSIGAENLTKPLIQKFIQENMDKRVKRTEIESDEVLENIKLLSESNLADFLSIEEVDVCIGQDSDGKDIWGKKRGVKFFPTSEISREKMYAVSEIRETSHGISIKLCSKEKANEMLGRHKELFTDKVDHTIPILEEIIKAEKEVKALTQQQVIDAVNDLIDKGKG